MIVLKGISSTQTQNSQGWACFMRGGIMQAYATVGFKKHLLTSVITIVD
jgi:hypothetical protein